MGGEGWQPQAVLSSEEKALAGIALPPALGVGSHCTPSGGKGIFSAPCLVRCRFQGGKWAVTSKYAFQL